MTETLQPAPPAAAPAREPRRLRVPWLLRREDQPAPPRLVLRVGVTGHRAKTLPTGPVLGARVREALAGLAALAHDLAQSPASLYADAEPTLRVVSPLASGADQLVAATALEQGYELHSPLPFGWRSYVRDFTTRRARREFYELLRSAKRVLEMDGSRATEALRNEAYLEVGRMVLRHSDVVVAVWDGEPPRGPGGTAQIVHEAALLEIPVVWIDAAYPHAIRAGTAADGAHTWSPSLATLAPPLHESYHLTAPLQRKRLQRFLVERTPLSEWGAVPRAWAWLGTVGSWHGKDPGAGEPRGAGATVPVLDAFRKRADALAAACAGLYRTAFLLNFILAALAVFLALVGHHFRLRPWAWLIASGELAAVVVILGTTLAGFYGQWHSRWLDYRLLAERLWQVEFSRLLGRVPAAFRTSMDDADDDPRRDWTAWLLRGMVREAGLPAICFTSAYLDEVRAGLVDRVIRTQLRYHGRREHVHHTLAHRLHRAGTATFLLAVAAITAHLLAHRLAHHGHFPPAMAWFGSAGQWAVATTFLAVFLPALGAALAGIRSQGEYLRIAAQSAVMSTRLERFEREATAPNAPTGSQALGRTVDRVAELMADELIGWRVVFRGKPLTLPS